MKKNIIISAFSALAIILSSCSEEKFQSSEGEGRLVISTSLSSAGSEVLARSSITDEDDIAELLSKLHIVISKSNGDAIRYWHNYQEMIDDGVAQENGNEISVNLNTGTYTVEGWTGDSVPASFVSIFYKGDATVTLEPYVSTSVDLICKICNVAANVEYADEIDHYLSDYVFTLGHSGGSLDFSGRDERKGYYMMPYGENYLEWELKGKLRDGNDFSLTGSTRVQKATLYTYKFSFDPSVEESGAVNIKVSVDETPLETIAEPTITFRTSPTIYRIDGKDSDYPTLISLGSDNALPAATGYVGDLDFIVRSSGLLNSVKLSTTDNLGDDMDEDMKNLLQEGLELLSAVSYDIGEDIGIESYGIIADVTSGTSSVSFSIKDALTGKIPEGEYIFTIEVTDYDYPEEDNETEELKGERIKTEQFYLSVSDDGTIAVGMTSEDKTLITPYSARIRGVVMGDDVVEAGFKVRVSGSDESWETLEVIPADGVTSRASSSGSYITATLENLHEGWEYEFITVFKTSSMDDFKDGAVSRTFTTVAPQLPNSSFEAWSGSSPLLIYDPEQETTFYPGAETVGSNGVMFWDSGNTGSSTLSKNVTTNSTEYIHDGAYSAKLESQFVGIGSTIGKFAAGNIFIGEYLETVGMSGGVLGWGRSFVYRPIAVKVWVKYTCGTVDRWQSNPYEITSGGSDQGIIYLALLTDDTTTHGNGTYPIKIDTSDTSSFFSKDWDTVIASGEKVFYESTEGDGMIEITIPLEYKDGLEDEKPAFIMMTCSASRAGDYFCGSTSSTMWIDDIELIYMAE